MDINTQRHISIEQVKDTLVKAPQNAEARKTSEGFSFRDILTQKTDDQSVRFSKHAASRLSTRNITISDEQMARLSEGAKRAEEKGIKDSLVIVDQMAFIVNVPSSTVVTAMQQNEAADRIFTNIDGAVIA